MLFFFFWFSMQEWMNVRLDLFNSNNNNNNNQKKNKFYGPKLFLRQLFYNLFDSWCANGCILLSICCLFFSFSFFVLLLLLILFQSFHCNYSFLLLLFCEKFLFSLVVHSFYIVVVVVGASAVRRTKVQPDPGQRRALNHFLLREYNS